MSSPRSDGVRTPTGHHSETEFTPTAGRNSSFTNANQTYANRAASALKASGIAQRFGKAIYGSSAAATGPSSATTAQTTNQKIEQVVKADLQFTARSDVLAMGLSHEKTQAAIAGKDFFQVLDVDEQIKVSKDLKESRETRDFDKMFAVTALKWGHQAYNHHIALSTSGGNILLYNLHNPTAKDSVTEYVDTNRCINSLSFSHTSGHVLLSGTSDGSVKVYDLRLKNRKPSLTFAKNGDRSREVQCSPHTGTQCAVIYDSGMIQRWDLRSPKVCDKRMSAHTSVGLSIDWHPEYDYLVSGGRDKLIQVWNMGKETRDADIVIIAPSAVSKVRWQIGGSTHSTNARNPASGVLNTCIASCGRSKFDNATYVWNPRRAFIPVNVIEHHTDSVSEIQWRSDKLLLTASRDKTFMQHDLTSEPLYVDNISSRAFDWSPTNDMTLMVQDKYRDQFGSMYSYKMADDDFMSLDDNPAAANFSSSSSRRRTTSAGAAVSGPTSTASSYQPGSQLTATGGSTLQGNVTANLGGMGGGNTLGRRPGSSTYKATNRPIQDVDYNQAVCFAAFPGFERETFQYLAENYTVLPKDDENLPQLCAINAKVAKDCGKFRTAKMWMILCNSMVTETEQFYKQKARQTELHQQQQELLQQQQQQQQQKEETEQRNNNGAPKRSMSSTQLLKPVNFEPGFNKVKRDRLSEPSAAPDHLIMSQMSTAPSTPLPISTGVELRSIEDKDEEDDYDDEDENDDGSGDGSSSANNMTAELVEAVSIPESNASNNNNNNNKHEKSGLSNEWVASSVDSQGQFSSFGTMASSPEHLRRGSKDSITQAVLGLGISAENNSKAKSEHLEYQDWLATLSHPWCTNNLLRKSAEFAAQEGEIQLCAVLGTLFHKFYPQAFPSIHVVEEWVLAYVELLQRCQLFVSAAEVIKTSEFESVRTQGFKETKLDALCHRCMANTNEVNASGGYWFCNNCKRLLDGCVLCREPAKGLAIALFTCGHKLHVDCIKEWLFEEDEVMCPSGCGRQLVK